MIDIDPALMTDMSMISVIMLGSIDSVPPLKAEILRLV